jgi:hypothetical protein
VSTVEKIISEEVAKASLIIFFMGKV